MDYFEIFPADEFQAEQLDAYFSANAENGVSKLDIIHLFGKDKLEDIQKRLSKATGLAFITVDFKGDPITEATSFSRFCREVRNNPVAFERCKSSDAFGSIQAAVTKKDKCIFLSMRSAGGGHSYYRKRTLSWRLYRGADPL